MFDLLMYIILAIFSILGLMLVMGLFFKKLDKLNSIDDGIKAFINYVMSKKSTSNIVDDNYILSPQELIALAQQFNRYFISVSLYSNYVDNGLLTAQYIVNGIKAEFKNDIKLLKNAIAIDVRNYYLTNRGIDNKWIYVQTLVEGQLVIKIACSQNGVNALQALQALQASKPQPINNVNQGLSETFKDDDEL